MTSKEEDIPLRPLFSVLGTVAVGATFLGSVLSFFMIFFMFDSWGIPYSYVASASDIVIGAAESTEALFGLAIIAGFLLLNRKIISLVKVSEFWAFVVFGVSTVWILVGYVNPIVSDDAHVLVRISTPLYFISFYALSTIAVFSSFLFAIKFKPVPGEFLPHKASALFYSSFLIPALFLVTYVSQNRAGDIVLYDSTGRCPSNEFVVWAGSNAIVSSCDPPPYDRSKSYFVSERQGLIMTKQFSNEVRIHDAQTH